MLLAPAGVLAQVQFVGLPGQAAVPGQEPGVAGNADVPAPLALLAIPAAPLLANPHRGGPRVGSGLDLPGVHLAQRVGRGSRRLTPRAGSPLGSAARLCGLARTLFVFAAR